MGKTSFPMIKSHVLCHSREAAWFSDTDVLLEIHTYVSDMSQVGL